MLKLYNIYKSLILESTDIEVVMDAIDKHYYVNIMYDGGKGDGSETLKRYCQVYNFGKTSNGNDAIRVFQVFGPNGRGWKTYRLDRIIKWEPLNFKFYKPVSDMDTTIPKYINNQDKTLGITTQGRNTSKFE